MAALLRTIYRLIAWAVACVAGAIVFVVPFAFGQGVSSGVFAVLVAIPLAGLGWALLPVFRAGPIGGGIVILAWGALATWHSWRWPPRERLVIIAAWALASILVAVLVLVQPPNYLGLRARNPKEKQDDA